MMISNLNKPFGLQDFTKLFSHEGVKVNKYDKILKNTQEYYTSNGNNYLGCVVNIFYST